MSSDNDFDSSSTSSSSSSSSSSDDDGGVKSIYRGAAIAAIIYERQRQKKRPCPDGSVKSRRYIPRDRIGAGQILMRDYFADNCVYSDETFRRRFRMQKSLFMRIHDAVLQHDPVNFQQRRDAFQKLGLSSLQKVTTALRMLAYGMAADQCDEYLKIGESTVMKSLKKFCNAVIEIFGSEYLRTPTEEDIQHILAENAARGFPGMVGSLDSIVLYFFDIILTP